VLKKSLFAAQHIFSTHLSLASLQIQNSPFGSNIEFAAVSLRQDVLPKKSEFAFKATFFQFFRSLFTHFDPEDEVCRSASGIRRSCPTWGGASDSPGS